MGLVCTTLGCYVPDKKAVETAIDLIDIIDVDKMILSAVKVDSKLLNQPLNITSLTDGSIRVKTIILSDFLKQHFREKVARFLAYKSDNFTDLSISKQNYITENIKYCFLLYLFNTKYEVKPYRPLQPSMHHFPSSLSGLDLDNNQFIEMNFAKHLYQKINTFELCDVLQKCYDYIFLSRINGSLRQLNPHSITPNV